jgi:hypothetical protein
LTTTGENQVAMGNQALNTNTTGTQNTAIGAVALQLNTTGGQNTAVGMYALNANTTASNNTAVGYQAGYTNTTGGLNTYLGTTAGYSNSTGNYNTIIGRDAGYLNTASGNTFIGANKTSGLGAGRAVTTGGGNVIIGGYDGSVAPISATGSNFVVLSDGDGNIVASAKTAQTFALQGGTLSSGTGIAFPATQSASSNANTLDDYEEGTWTPTIAGNGTTFPGTSYFGNTGKYVKVGDVVWVSFDVDVNGVGTQSNSASIAGLPFAVPDSGNLSNGGGGLNYVINLQTNYVFQSCYPQNNSSYLFIIGRTAASTSTVTVAATSFFANSVRVAGFAWYRTTV